MGSSKGVIAPPSTIRGTDVAYALVRGVGAVDAVEIDPGIRRIGQREHPDQPYADARVHAYVNDGRAFLRSTDARYDLIVFALPDSLTLVSTTANIRLESYLFTREAFASARDRLAPGGIFVLYNCYRQPWLLQEIDAMLADVFRSSPLVRQYEASIGSAAVLAVLSDPLSASGATALDLVGAPAPATDDWPFLYLRDREIASY